MPTEILEQQQVERRQREQERPEPAQASRLSGWFSRERIETSLIFVVTALLLLVAWHACSQSGWLPAYIVPSPLRVWAKFEATFTLLLEPAWLTAAEIAVGFLSALIVAVALAASIVFFKTMEKVAFPWLLVLQVIPKVALGPLLVLWLGFGFFPKALMAFLLAFFPIMIDTIIGMRSVENNSINLLRSMGANRLSIFRYLQFPHALPHLFGSMKVAMTLAVVGALVGELIGADDGLGHVLVAANGSLDTELLFVSIGWISVQALIFYGIVVVAEKLCVSWHSSHRSIAARMEQR